MRNRWWGWVGLSLLFGAGDVAAQQPYEGQWAGTAAACRNDESDDRMEITGNRFFWYETRCTAQNIMVTGSRSWSMRMSCEGEGQRFAVRPSITLPSPGRLVMENGPVGRDPRRQSYVRCGG